MFGFENLGLRNPGSISATRERSFHVQCFDCAVAVEWLLLARLAAGQGARPRQVVLRLPQLGRLLQLSLVVEGQLRILARFRNHLSFSRVVDPRQARLLCSSLIR